MFRFYFFRGALISVIFFVNFFSFTTGVAQNTKLDSLYSFIKGGKEDTVQLKRLNSISAIYLEENNYDSCIKYSQKALKIALSLDFKRGSSRAYNVLGLSYLHKGNYPTALTNFQAALKLAEEVNNIKWQARNLESIGLVYHKEGDFAKAMEYYLKTLRIAELMTDTFRIATLQTMLGDLNYDMNEDNKAMAYYIQSSKLFEKLANQYEVINKMQRIGNVLSRQAKYRQAQVYFLNSLEKAKALGDSELIEISLSNIGNFYQYQNKYTEALEYYLKAQPITEHVGNQERIASGFLNIGSVYYSQKKYKPAEAYLNKAHSLSKKIAALEVLMAANQNLSELYSETGDFKKAINYLTDAHKIQDSLFNIENIQETTRSEMNYEFEKKEAVEKAEHEKELAVTAADKKRQRLLSWLIVAIAVSAGIISLIIFRSLRITKKQKVKIEEQKQLVEEHQKDIIDSITYAKRIQDAILPPIELIKQKLPESFVLYKPKDIVAGDFYWMEEFDDIIFIAAADCTGHGVPGAMVSMVCSNALTRSVKEFGLRKTGKILDKTKELVLETFEKSAEDVKDGMDISFLAINKINKTIEWSGANNPLWYILPQDPELIEETENSFKEIKGDKQPIGKTEKEKSFVTQNIEFKSGTTFYLFTDGLADQFGGPLGKKFKYKQLLDLLLKNSNQTKISQHEIIETAFLEWKGNLEQVDDICLIGITI